MIRKGLQPPGKAMRCRLMTVLLDRACRRSELSRRQLAQQLGVTVGTVSSYYRGLVDPLNCRLVIQQRLADLNGATVDEVCGFYRCGEWSGLSDRPPVLRQPILRGLRRCRVADRKGAAKPLRTREAMPA